MYKREGKIARKLNRTFEVSPERLPRDPASMPTTSRPPGNFDTQPKSKCMEDCLNYIYNKENKTVCNKTLTEWCKIIGYCLLYFTLLAAYTMIFLYGALSIIKAPENDPRSIGFTDLYNYVKNGVGLSATPTAENEYALIWYKNGERNEYQKYLTAIDKLIQSRNMTSDLIRSLGPCGKYPYGYGETPCAIIRVNKQLRWSGRPLSANSSLTQMAPKEVRSWVKSGKKMLWLHCDGYNLYDSEHIGPINYYPYPPGYDPKVFPLDLKSFSPLVAVQFSKYTQGVSVDVNCKLWYEDGPSNVYFTLYIDPKNKLYVE